MGVRIKKKHMYIPRMVEYWINKEIEKITKYLCKSYTGTNSWQMLNR